MWQVFKAIVWRDMLLAWRQRSDVLTALGFFCVVATLFPLGVGPERDALRSMAPGVLWVASLFSVMLTLGRVFAIDHADGTLEQLMLSATPLPWIVLGKVLAHWCVTGVPLLVMAPLMGVAFDVPTDAIGVLVSSLALGTPTLSLIGSIGAALTLGLRGGGVLLAVLVLPLYVPVLIFGAGSVSAQASGLGAGAHLWLLSALLAFSLALAPWAAAAALRVSIE